jgi:hypothetical protein
MDLQRILREAGYRVVGPAACADEIGPLLRRGKIDCAVLDIDLGSPAMPAVAKLLDGAGVPFVMLGAGHSITDRPTVDKPYSAAGLLQSVEAAMAGSPPQMPLPSSASVPRLSWPRVFPSL